MLHTNRHQHMAEFQLCIRKGCLLRQWWRRKRQSMRHRQTKPTAAMYDHIHDWPRRYGAATCLLPVRQLQSKSPNLRQQQERKSAFRTGIKYQEPSVSHSAVFCLFIIIICLPNALLPPYTFLEYGFKRSWYAMQSTHDKRLLDSESLWSHRQFVFHRHICAQQQ